jgi:hypothetical protein
MLEILNGSAQPRDVDWDNGMDVKKGLLQFLQFLQTQLDGCWLVMEREGEEIREEERKR